MLYHYEPVVKATIAFIKLMRVQVNNATINETLQNHPDWPSLFSVSESLKRWNIPNAAGRISAGDIDQMPVPFLAYSFNEVNPISVVETVSESTITYYTSDSGKKITQPKPDFIKQWGGIYLIAEPNEHSGEDNYVRNKRKAFVRSLIPVALLVLLSAFTGIAFNNNLQAFTGNLLFPSILFAVQFAGVIVSSLLLWYEMDRNNPLLQKVCTGIAKGNCNAILTGKAAKLFNFISWSEIGFFYFAGGLLLMLTTNIVSSIALVSLLNLLALPYIVFSVYYQWQVAKQWCVLCLAVQTLLFTGGLAIAGGELYQFIPQVTTGNVLQMLLIYAAPVLLWYVAKPYFKKLQEAKNTHHEYLRIKFNSEIFDTLLKKQKQVSVDTDGLGIVLGNPQATNTIVKVCNPYCGPCSAAHPKIEKLLEEVPNLSAKIIFTAPNDKTHTAYQPVSHLLAIAEKNNPALIKQALDDWYLQETKSYTGFAAKYPMNGELERQGKKIEAMDNWCIKNSIQATPTIFINGYKLPDAYSIEDLRYFLVE
jgi:thiol-disulfide isomerase/thioredoxin